MRSHSTEAQAVDSTHITSLIVHAKPSSLQSVLDQVRQLPSAEVHTGEPANKFIVLLETKDEQQILEAIDRIQGITGVLNASMVYHHIDDE